MHTLLTAIGLLVLSGLQAQTNDWFAPVGATWTYYDWTDGPPWLYHQRPYFQAKVVKDSVILGKECRKMLAFNSDGTQRPNSTVWINTDSSRIYTLHADTFLVFFDRTLIAGDSLWYYPVEFSIPYNYTCCWGDTVLPAQFKVDSVSQVLIGGEILKRWHLNDLSINPFVNSRLEFFTEKLGAFSLFGRADACCAAGFAGDFHCYEDQTTFINTDTVDCTYPVGIASPEAESIQIAPNPTNGHFEIILPASSDLTSTKASVYSLDGRLIREVDLPDHTNKLNFDLPTGLYLIQVHSGERQYIKRLSLIR